MQTDSLLITGLKSHSSPNTVFYSTLTGVTSQAPPVILIADSKREYFDFKSMYIGCSINTDIARIGAACSITAAGVRRDGTSVSTTFEFKGGNVMALVHFPPSFNQMYKVSFSTAGSPLEQDALATSFDNLVYQTYKCPLGDVAVN